MLSIEKNQQLTQVGPGTPMGELLRRYWMPIAGVSELETHPTKRVRLLGEDLVLYKDLSGRYGLIDRHCPHRRADMFHGIPEECGLRCAYHGWLFDEAGQCREQPYEDLAHPELNTRENIKVKSYLIEAKAGILWAYMGPKPAPLIPHWEQFAWDNGFVQVTISEVPCNWFQAQENSIDPVHFEWQHDTYLQRKHNQDFNHGPRHLKIKFEEFEYGFIYRRVMEGRDETHPEWTVGRVCLWPNCLMTGNHFQWRVPIDDENTLSVLWTYVHVPKEKEPYVQDQAPTWHAPLTDENGVYIDTHITNQDIIAWIGQGTIADRTQEHLGASDQGIVMMRRRFFDQMEAVGRGEEPKAIIRDPVANLSVPLPIMMREEHTEGRTIAEIDASPTLQIHARRFVIQAGQPRWVREQFEAAMGMKMLDDEPPERFHK